MPVPEGSLLGEAAFFTEVPQLEAVRSLTVCRVLVISRAAFQSLERAFPTASRQVLQNLRAKAEQVGGWVGGWVGGRSKRVRGWLGVRVRACMGAVGRCSKRARACVRAWPRSTPLRAPPPSSPSFKPGGGQGV